MIAWHQKLAIGGVGALCLSLLKLISANFYLGAADRNVALGAYLTYFAYLILGMAVGYFLCEQSPEAEKTRKSAFLMGLLAPSILIAIVSKPIAGPPTDSGQAAAVPTLQGSLLDLLGVTAHAQAPASAQVPVEVLQKADAGTSFWDGVMSALGLQPAGAKQYHFVVGQTDDEKLAKQRASEINGIMQKYNRTQPVKILKPAAGNHYFLTIGDGTSAAGAAATKQSATDSAVKALTGAASAADKSAAQVMLKGQILATDTLRQGKYDS